jgi:hypothetical protein
MTIKTTDHSTAGSGTIGLAADAGQQASVARAQAELIDMLARLVLAAVEADATGSRMHRPRVNTRDRRSRQPDA